MPTPGIGTSTLFQSRVFATNVWSGLVWGWLYYLTTSKTNWLILNSDCSQKDHWPSSFCTLVDVHSNHFAKGVRTVSVFGWGFCLSSAEPFSPTIRLKNLVLHNRFSPVATSRLRSLFYLLLSGAHWVKQESYVFRLNVPKGSLPDGLYRRLTLPSPSFSFWQLVKFFGNWYIRFSAIYGPAYY